MSDYSDSGPVLSLKVKDGLQWKDDRWVFYSEEFRSFSYGDTEQEAIDEFFNASVRYRFVQVQRRVEGLFGLQRGVLSLR